MLGHLLIPKENPSMLGLNVKRGQPNSLTFSRMTFIYAGELRCYQRLLQFLPQSVAMLNERRMNYCDNFTDTKTFLFKFLYNVLLAFILDSATWNKRQIKVNSLCVSDYALRVLNFIEIRSAV